MQYKNNFNSEKNLTAVLPAINLADKNIVISTGAAIARVYLCVLEVDGQAAVQRLTIHELPLLDLTKIDMGDVKEENKEKLINFLNKYRDYLQKINRY